MITTTLNRIRANYPCTPGWTRLLAGLGKTQADDEPLFFADILRINGLTDALWACRCEPQYAREWRLFAVACARRVQHLMTDERSLRALDVAEAYANGDCSDEDLRDARIAAYDYIAAAHAAYAAAAYDYIAAAAAYAAAAYAAAAYAAYAAADAADAADAAAEREWQAVEFLRIVSETSARDA